MDASSRPRRLKWWLIGILLALGVLALGYWSWLLTARSQLDRALNDLRERGYPASIAELQALYPAHTPSEYAEFDAVGERWRVYADARRSSSGGETIAPEKEAAILDEIEAYAAKEILPLGDTGPSVSGVWFVRMLRMEVTVGMLLSITVSNAAAGDCETALRAWRLAGQLIRKFDDKSQESMFDRKIGLEEARLNALAKMAESGFLSAFSDAGLRRLMPGAEDETWLLRMFTMNIVVSIVTILDELRDMDWDKAVAKTGSRCKAVLWFSPYGTVTRTRLVSEAVKAIDRLTVDARAEGSTYYFHNTMLYNDLWSGSNRRFYSVIARYRLIRVLLAAELYRREYGGWPEALERLTPEFLEAVPADPFDGKPLRWDKSDGEFRVYSVGPEGDIVFVLKTTEADDE